MKIYGKKDCTQCKGLLASLDEKGIKYEYTDDFKETAKIGSKYMIMSAPIIVMEDGKAYSYAKFSEEVYPKL